LVTELLIQGVIRGILLRHVTHGQIWMRVRACTL